MTGVFKGHHAHTIAADLGFRGVGHAQGRRHDGVAFAGDDPPLHAQRQERGRACIGERIAGPAVSVDGLIDDLGLAAPPRPAGLMALRSWIPAKPRHG